MQCPLLANVANAVLIIIKGGATSVLPTDAITSLTRASLYASGGARLAFPGVTTFGFGSDNGGWTVESADASTVVAFPALTQFQGPLAAFTRVDVRAIRGGVLQLPLLSELGVGSAYISAIDANSVVELGSLRRLFGFFASGAEWGRVEVPTARLRDRRQPDQDRCRFESLDGRNYHADPDLDFCDRRGSVVFSQGDVL